MTEPGTPTATGGLVNFDVGSVVKVHGMQGTVRFVGSTQFATGKWVGIELDSAEGKNDGSVQGVRYFECKDNYGVFVRASQVKDVLSFHPIASSSSSSSSSPFAAGISGASDLGTSGALSLGTSGELSTPITSKAARRESSIVSSRRESVIPSSLTLQQHQQQSGTGGKMVPFKDFEELRLRLKLLEAKRMEDRERIREFEKLKSDAEQFQVSKTRLTAKCQELQAEVLALKKSVKEAANVRQDLEARHQEAMESLELVTLDKEVAEEKAETLDLEVQILKEQIEEMKLNVEVLQEEQQQSDRQGGGVPGESMAASVGEAQLLKQNERLKEALVKLRDVTTSRENELERSNKEMERDLLHFKDLQGKFDETRGKLSVAEDQIEHLKMQLDDALENTTMIEMLTVKNLKLSEVCAPLVSTFDSVADPFSADRPTVRLFFEMFSKWNSKRKRFWI